MFCLESLEASTTPLFYGSELRPADAVVLFDGKDLSQWLPLKSKNLSAEQLPARWKVKNGYMEVAVGEGNIVSKQDFGDAQIHVEFWLPLTPNESGQHRANSGVYVQGCYEIQVLDSYGLNPSPGDCGAVYGIHPPLVNACRPPRNWQSFDIVFHAPRFDNTGNKIANARMTVFQNGVLIQDNVEVPEPTRSAGLSEATTGPLMLQDHGSAIRYRNIWVRPLVSTASDGKRKV